MDFKNEIISEAVIDKEPLTPKGNFAKIIKDSVLDSNWDETEKQGIVSWLSTKGDSIDKIMRSSHARKLLWILYRDKEDYLANLCRKLNRYSNPVRHWLKNFKKLELIDDREATIGIEKHYRLSDKYPKIVKALVELIRIRDGEKWLQANTKGKIVKGKIINSQYESIKKSIKKKSKKARPKRRK